MNCPDCKSVNNSRVLDSRPAKVHIRRRRECCKCGLKYTTFEVFPDGERLVLRRHINKLEKKMMKIADIVFVEPNQKKTT